MISASLFHALFFGSRHACDRSQSLSRAVRYGSILSAGIGLGFVIGGGVRLGFAKQEGAGPPTRTQMGALPALAVGAAALTEALLFTSYELIAAGACD
ncbi:MAG: hypothetical protein JWN04_2053 [Myxococcaceae bacterium]|nr:hypothetical protein [Myxococcaceae bacterium]